MWPSDQITTLLGVQNPIIQAPMAGSATVELAAAVSNAGGIGSLGCAGMSLAKIKEASVSLQSATDKPFNLNFFTHDNPIVDSSTVQRTWERVKPFYQAVGLSGPPLPLEPGYSTFNSDILKLMLEVKPAIISFHFGLPAIDMVRALQQAGCRVLCSATTVAEAISLNQSGVDGIIAQGWEAGGHRGSFEVHYEDYGIGTMALVPQVVDAVDVPVIATGGIADGRGIAAAFALGASGVQMGSAFLSCPEASISDTHREALRNASDQDTRLTRAYSGRPARAKNNEYMEIMAEHQTQLPDFPSMYDFSRPLMQRAKNGENQFLLYGQATSLNREQSAAKLVETLTREAFDSVKFS